MRLFFCVELGDEVKTALAEVAKRCQKIFGQGSWVAPENYHLTLRFLGEVDEEKLPSLLAVGEKVAQKSGPFSLALTTLGGFPHPRQARVLWVGPNAESPKFRELARRVEEALGKLGFPPEKRKALPHVTLARFKVPKDLRDAIVKETPVVPVVQVASLTLMRSELRPDGAKYTPILRWTLGEGLSH